MMRRMERVNHLIRQEISELLQRQVKDPRLGNFITVTEVVSSSDLKYAKVFVCCVGREEDRQEMMSALSSASGFLRSELARRLKLRRVPELVFEWDDSIERGAHILELIDKVMAERDEEQEDGRDTEHQ